MKKILISHRGNLTGKVGSYENNPDYIRTALDCGYDVEIDVWLYGKIIYLGHDSGVYPVPLSWLKLHKSKLWIHCKSLQTLVFFTKIDEDYNYFYHTNEDAVLTSHNDIWALPGNQPLKNSIAVLPEINNDDLSDCIGICSDFIENYKK